ncbi:MAG: amino acid permease [marine benthic group bacterium]|nr:amino acid permease [Gemmatimonadota bacterium]
MTGDSKLQKNLTLFDVYAISTGAMFSSGFFLLPGIAYAQAGPAVVLAYLLAGIAVLPAMLSKAELATAMPRAGGTYYFLDRALGPLVGTVGGLGAWLALVLKSAFALVGLGAYLGLFFDVPIRPVAVGLTLLFLAFNLFGAKETSGLQRVLVSALVGILILFVIEGLLSLGETGIDVREERFTPFMPHGTLGLLSTVGLVFVSYAGLTKVASVAEEVQNPDRNLPLGMILSLVTATLIYVLGVAVMVAVLEPESLAVDLTPVASAADVVMHWLPGRTELWLIVIAAFAAFASTANAGIMSASRFMLAMGRDHLISDRFARIGRFKTPTWGVLLTSLATIAAVLLLDVEGLAKLASAFMLLLFALINLAVIVMRESEIEAYDPGFKSPLYPWMQIAGFLIPIWLILEMGWLALGFTAGVIGVSTLWYFLYAHHRLVREGAIYHVFARLGRQKFEGLDRELRQILKEKGLRQAEPFDELVAHASVEDVAAPIAFDELVSRASSRLSGVLGVKREELENRFLAGTKIGMTPVSRGTALPHLRLANLEKAQLLMARCAPGVEMEGSGVSAQAIEAAEPIQAVFFLISPEGNPGEHLRMLARIASRVDDDGFLEEWLTARDEQDLKEALVHDDRLCSLTIRSEGPTADMVGIPLREAPFHDGTLVALVSRRTGLLVPTGSTILEEGDRLTILGGPAALERIRDRFGAN